MTPCEEWALATDRDGYGVKTVGRKTLRAHRWVWANEHGPIPEGMIIMHLCDNPTCVNLDHLKLGTIVENNHDREAKGRGKASMKCGHTDIYIAPSGQLKCRTCRAANSLRYYYKEKQLCQI